MRRDEREVRDRGEIERILEKAEVCHLAFAVQNEPYVVPLCFGYEEGVLYFHSAPEGIKIDMIRANQRVAFQATGEFRIVQASTACGWGARYRSVAGTGTASIITDAEEKRKGLDVLMRHYTEGPFEYERGPLDGSVILRVQIDTITGKES